MQSLAEARAARGLSQRALAAAGVSNTAVHRLERGLGRPTARVARRLAAALGLDPRQVAELAPAPPRPRGPRRAAEHPRSSEVEASSCTYGRAG